MHGQLLSPIAWRASLWLAAAMLTACRAAPELHRVAPTTTGGPWPLLAPATLGERRQVSQMLRGEHDGQRFSLRCAVTVDDDNLTVVGLTGMGMRAFTLKYDGANLHEERAPQVPPSLRAERLLNDLQFAFWPLPQLQRAWSSVGGVVSEPLSGTRRLQRDGKVVLEAYYAGDLWSGRVWLRHFDDNYVLSVDTVALVGAK